ncbi:unnamed protein product [Protopolystoma xenopodis]|uniref:Uncharacterized protein n=1 Tax=Protopolystoma xenopodis TaxID=117903 RepID=A0A3S5A5H4_9PLAT|nr:unnamed protein product [Protopolystoma xenopodis]
MPLHSDCGYLSFPPFTQFLSVPHSSRPQSHGQWSPGRRILSPSGRRICRDRLPLASITKTTAGTVRVGLVKRFTSSVGKRLLRSVLHMLFNVQASGEPIKRLSTAVVGT